VKRKFAEGEELGVPWEDYADGMPHRLKRNRDFPDLSPFIVRQAARNAAKRMNKAVQAAPDRLGKNKSKFLWVQFADYELDVGEPCKCGGRRILRFHQLFGRCAACNALILFTQPSKDTDGDSSPDDRYGWAESEFGW
jgi:hypothetical protein